MDHTSFNSVQYESIRDKIWETTDERMLHNQCAMCVLDWHVIEKIPLQKKQKHHWENADAKKGLVHGFLYHAYTEMLVRIMLHSSIIFCEMLFTS